MPSQSFTTSQAGAQLTRDGHTWGTTTIYWDFRDSMVIGTMPSGTDGFQRFNETQIAATRMALTAWQDVSGISFVENSPSQYSNSGWILFGNYTVDNTNTSDPRAAFADYPDSTVEARFDWNAKGDVWINSSMEDNANPALWNYGLTTLVHEIGHALGLQHPGNYNAGDGVNDTWEDDALYNEDTAQFTVMSYFGEDKTGASFWKQMYEADGSLAYLKDQNGNFLLDSNGNKQLDSRHYNPAAPLMDDIAAIQRIYGAPSGGAFTGNTIFGFNCNIVGRPWYQATGQNSPLIFCAYDTAGNDTFDFSGYRDGQQVNLNAGRGNFSNVGGMKGNVSIYEGVVIENAFTGIGDDTLIGNQVGNVLKSGAGADTLYGNGGADTLEGGADKDTLWGGLVGDSLDGGDGDDEIYGEQGGDEAWGRAGADSLYGGSEGDTLHGDEGLDKLWGGQGSDTLWGGADDDELRGESEGDTLHGEAGADKLYGGDGIDTLNGGSEGDELRGEGDADTLNGEAGADKLFGGAGGDTLNGGADDDELSGEGDDDTLNAGAGTDTLFGGAGTDKLYGEAGNDILDGGAGADILDGGEDADGKDLDIVTYISFVAAAGSTAGITLDLSTGVSLSDADGDTFIGIEGFLGSNFDDHMIGNGDANFFSALLGNDHLEGKGGNDILVGDGGGDILDGGDGIDTVKYGGATSGVTLTAANGGGTGSVGEAAGDTFLNVEVIEGSDYSDTMIGGAGTQVFIGGKQNDTLRGGADNDVLSGGDGVDLLDGGDGIDQVDYSAETVKVIVTLENGVGSGALLSASNGDSFAGIEQIVGTAYGDQMTGGAGAQLFIGGAGGDVLKGGADNDVLEGGAGDDSLDGGDGLDEASYSGAAAAITLNLATGVHTGDAQGDSFTSIETFEGSRFDDTMTGKDSARDNFLGGEGADTLRGGSGDDILEGGAGADNIEGGDGFDVATYFYSAAAITLDFVNNVRTGDAIGDVFTSIEVIGGSDGFGDFIRGSNGVEEIRGYGGADKLFGAGGDDGLVGGAGNDELDGEAGNDLLEGGAGNDKFMGGQNDAASRDRVIYFDAPMGVNVNLSLTTQTVNGTSIALLSASDGLGGTDTFLIANDTGRSSVEDATGSAFADRMVANEGGSELIARGGDDYLRGMQGNDVLNGGAGTDNIDGGAGDVDLASYQDDAAAVTVNLSLATNQAKDGSGTFDTLTNIEGAVGSAFGDTLTGKGGVNRLEGREGNDTLDGLAGNDVMVGGTGDDIYFSDSTGDSIVELVGGGSDILKTSVERGSIGVPGAVDTIFSLPSEVEDLQLLGSVKFGFGNVLDNRMIGNGAANVMDGAGGSDTFWGYGGNDVYYFDSFGDTIGLGAAPRSGIAGAGEAAGGGLDEIRLSTASLTPVNTSVIYTIDTAWAQQIENVVLQDDARAIDITGNALANRLIGNAHGQTIRGQGGNDTLDGLGGDDTLYGDGGDDTLQIAGGTWYGNTFTDTAHGGAGADHLVVDYSGMDLNNEVDVAPATADAGGFTGTIKADGSIRTVFDGIDRMTLTSGSGKDNITTLSNNDVISTNAGDDLVTSVAGAGRDRFDGGGDVDSFAANWSDLGTSVVLDLNNEAGVTIGTGDAERYIRRFERAADFSTGSADDEITLSRNAVLSDLVKTNGGDDVVTAFSGIWYGDTAQDFVHMGLGRDDLILDYRTLDINNEVITTSLASGADGISGLVTIDGSLRMTFSGIERLTIFGGAAQDRITGISTVGGLDRIDGGGNFDAIIADWSDLGATQHLTVDMNNVVAAIMGSGTTERYIKNIERLESFESGAGNDTIIFSLDATVAENVITNDGNDTVTVYGGTWYGNTGTDTVAMEAGSDDHLIVDYSGMDLNNEVNIEPVTADAGGFSGTVKADGSIRTIFSGVDRMTVTAGSGNDGITTLSNNDVINTNWGNDYVASVAGAGRDRFDGGGDIDSFAADWSDLGTAIVLDLNNAAGVTISSGATERYLRGFERAADFVTGSGNDQVTLSRNGTLSDLVTTNGGNDVVTAFSGIWYGDTAQDFVHMGGGQDDLILDYRTLDVNNEIVTQSLVAGVDGISGLVTIDGSLRMTFSGVNRLTILGGDGQDWITGISTVGGLDRIDGGTNFDTVVADWSDLGATAHLTVDANKAVVATMGSGASERYIKNIERLDTFKSGAGNDTFFLSKNAGIAEHVITSAGNDAVTVYGGVWYGDTGTDTVEMGAGTDDHLIVDYSGMDLNNEVNIDPATADAGGFSATVKADGSIRTIFSGVDRMTITAGSGNDGITTLSNNDVINTNAGNDYVASVAGAGRDRFDGGADTDSFAVDWSDLTSAIILDLNNAAGVTIGSGATERYLRGFERAADFVTGSGNDIITLSRDGGLADLVTTNAGNDTVTVFGGSWYGNTALDTVNLGPGSDHLIVDYSGMDINNELNLSGLTSTVDGFAGSISVDGSVRTVLSGVDRFTIFGGAAGDFIVTGSGNDLFRGAGANDYFDGAGGSDTADYSDKTGAVMVTLSGATEAGVFLDGAREDTLVNVENLIGGSGDDKLTGDASANALTGNAGNDTLDGGLGADTMTGGAGNDTYVVDTASDKAVEAAAGGIDLVNSSVGYTLGAEVENLTLTGAAAINGTGNALANAITGNAAANILDGGAGADTMTGGAGNDTYVVDKASDKTIELAGGGTDLAKASVTYTLAAEVENLTLTGTAAINGTGNGGANTILGNAAVNSLFGGGGNDILNAGAGADTMTGGTGDDTYVVDDAGDKIVEAAAGGVDLVQSSITYTLAAEVENLTLTGAAAIDGAGNALANSILGNGAANGLSGGDGNDTLDGGTGADTMTGGAGNDTYVVDNALDKTVEIAGGGIDLVKSSITYTLAAEVENLTLTGAAAINGTGNALANAIVGNAAVNSLSGGEGNDTLDGGAGADTMTGGAGNDTYVVDNAADKTVEADAGGVDLVQSSVGFSLAGQYVENLTLTGVAAINGTGNGLANILIGNAAANVLNGGTGADTMNGGAGNDTYVVDNAADKVVESSSAGGTDTVQSSVGFSLAGQYVENLVLTGSGAVNGTGNSLANSLTGNAAANVLNGGTGADTMNGGDGNDTYVIDDAGDKAIEASTTGGTDTVQSSVSFSLAGQYIETLILTGSGAINATGNSLANTITGNAAANVLNGGTGADTMNGGAGNDTYVVDEVADKVIEASATGGTDTVQSAVTFSIAGQYIEALILTGSGAINGTGNSLANTLTGNAAANVLNGGTGADTMNGGAGNDTYVVDDVADKVIESSSTGGADLVQSSVTFSIAGQYVESLTLTGSGAINGTGNGLNNVLTGNAGANVLNGGTGADTMNGGAGNDIYVVDNAGDTVSEASGGGLDRVESSISFSVAGLFVEDVTLTGGNAISATGNGLANSLVGNGAANTLAGADGADRLFGRGGNDTLQGGAGADSFHFDSALGSGNVDKISDFSVVDDTIMLDRAVFTGFSVDGTLATGAFVSGIAAADADDRILYESATGKIFYDADGNGAGAATLFAQVTAGTALTNLDFTAYTVA